MKVFVTGASGFIGRTIADRYREAGAEVAGMDLRPDPAAGVVVGDVSVPGVWQDAAAGAEVVVHTAAFVGFRLRDPGAIWRVNALGTKHALDAARRAGARRFVHFSSITVFGFDFPDGVDEARPVQATGIPYVDTKIASEQHVLAAHAAGEAEVTVIRPGDVYGPRSDAWAVRPVNLLKSGRMVLPEGFLSPVYVENLVDAVVAAAGTPAASGQVLTVSDGEAVSNREFFGHYARLLGRRLRIVPAPVARAAALAAHRLRLEDDVNPQAVRYFTRRGTYANAKARSLLGWAPRVGFAEGMASTCAWLREAGHV